MKGIELVEGFAAKSITKKSLMEQYGVSKDHLQKRLKEAGFVYDRAAQHYVYTGDLADISDQDVTAILAVAGTAKATAKATESATKESTSGIVQLDIFDVLIHGTDTSKKGKSQRAYYLDNEVLELLDSIKGSKSAFVNEAIKAVFRQKGML